MRQTSIEVYHQIKEEGLLGNLQLQVYGAVFQYGPGTQQEIWLKSFPSTQARNIMPRFAELEHMGVIKTVGRRPCQVTERNCLVWDVTDQLPDKIGKTETKNEKIKRLEKEIFDLKTKLFNVTNGELML